MTLQPEREGREPEREGRAAARLVEVDAERAGQRLDNFLMQLLGGVPRSRVYRLVRKGEVRVNGHRVGPSQRLASGDRVRVPPLRIETPPDPSRPPQHLSQALERAIVYEDERLIVLDKPAGLAVHGGSGLSFGVIEALRASRPGDPLELVHRLDRATSGCLIVARKPSVLRTLHALLREGRFEKRYLALLEGHWRFGRKRIEAPLRTDLRVHGERTVRVHEEGKPSASEFRPVQFYGGKGAGPDPGGGPRAGSGPGSGAGSGSGSGAGARSGSRGAGARAQRATLVEVQLYTGRTHQIRVHAAHAGHPVAGDEKYGDEPFNARMRELGLARMFLHAEAVSFEWPGGGVFSASAPLPRDLGEFLEKLHPQR